MRQRATPAPGTGQRLNLNLGGADNSTSPKILKNFNHLKQAPTGRNRLLILEQIADRWASRGLYRNPSRAMAALLGVSE